MGACGVGTRVWLAMVLLGLSAAPLRAAEAPCRWPQVATAQITQVIDGATLLSSDGRRIRLAGIEVADRDALSRVVGREIALHSQGLGSEPALDRHGRLTALVVDGGGEVLQFSLLRQGLARVAPPFGDAACARVLITAEREARRAGLGLWADPAYVSKRAGNPPEITAVRGRFAVVEGQVQSVRESGGQIYINFGGRWTEDFTVTVPKRSERMFTDAGLALKALGGRGVRVRGVVEERGGPWIEAVHSAQIELLDDGGTPPLPARSLRTGR